MGMKEITSAMGKVRIGISAERKWNRNTIMTRETMIASSIRLCFKVLIDSLISPPRS